VFERVTLVVLLVLGLEASRGLVWFALVALITLPTMLNGVLRTEGHGSRRIGSILLASSVGAVAVAAAVIATKPQTWFTSNYPPAAAQATAEAAGATSKVFANGAYSDWLLLVQPSLRGRIAYDARFELLPDGRLADAAAVSIGRSDWRRILAPFDVVVLRPEESEMHAALLRDGGWHEVPTNRKIALLRRSS
jgi:hypothetical protein